jgi:hypothetical protein
MSRVDKVLAQYPESAVTSRLLKALYAAVPGSPVYNPSWTLENFVRAQNPGATDAQIAKAREIADTDPTIGDLLWMGGLMDKGDKGIALVGGMMSAWKMFSGQGANAAMEMDPQQRNDAVLKAIGLAYLTFKAFPGSMPEKAAMLQQSDAGKHLVMYYGSIEVALPFADNLLQAGAEGFTNMISSQAGAQQQRLAALAAGHDLGQVSQMLTAVTGQLSSAVDVAKQYVTPVTQQIGPFLPGAVNAADKAAGVIATAADLLDVYTILAARLAAECAARRALTA